MEEYKGYKLYFDDEKYKKILEGVIDKEFEVEKEYKEEGKTYVAKIRCQNKNYILKQFFIKKKFKKFLSIFKEGESVKTFKSIEIISKKIPELVKIYGAGIKRKGIFIEEEFILMEYVEGRVIDEDKFYIKILKIIEKIHKIGRYHGDCNPGNFLFDSDSKIYIIDTKVKKMLFGNYRAHYDVLTLFKYFNTKPEYPYKQDIFYKIAYMVRQYRNKKR